MKTAYYGQFNRHKCEGRASELDGFVARVWTRENEVERMILAQARMILSA
jgi:hypothetical protein